MDAPETEMIFIFSESQAVKDEAMYGKKAQLSLTNPRDACEKFARFT